MRLHAACLAALATTSVLAGCATGARHAQSTHGQSGHGHEGLAEARIEGVIRHPAHVVPAMRVCAIPADPPRMARCIDTRAGDDRYRIEGLPPGDYQVFAEVAGGSYRIGGHVQAVQCIRAPCPDQPKTITLAAGATLPDIDLTFFDEAREDFPALPVE